MVCNRYCWGFCKLVVDELVFVFVVVDLIREFRVECIGLRFVFDLLVLIWSCEVSLIVFLLIRDLLYVWLFIILILFFWFISMIFCVLVEVFDWFDFVDFEFFCIFGFGLLYFLLIFTIYSIEGLYLMFFIKYLILLELSLCLFVRWIFMFFFVVFLYVYFGYWNGFFLLWVRLWINNWVRVLKVLVYFVYGCLRIVLCLWYIWLFRYVLDLNFVL